MVVLVYKIIMMAITIIMLVVAVVDHIQTPNQAMADLAVVVVLVLKLAEQ
jgi:hypothetical protein